MLDAPRRRWRPSGSASSGSTTTAVDPGSLARPRPPQGRVLRIAELQDGPGHTGGHDRSARARPATSTRASTRGRGANNPMTPASTRSPTTSAWSRPSPTCGRCATDDGLTVFDTSPRAFGAAAVQRAAAAGATTRSTRSSTPTATSTTSAAHRRSSPTPSARGDARPARRRPRERPAPLRPLRADRTATTRSSTPASSVAAACRSPPSSCDPDEHVPDTSRDGSTSGRPRRSSSTTTAARPTTTPGPGCPSTGRSAPATCSSGSSPTPATPRRCSATPRSGRWRCARWRRWSPSCCCPAHGLPIAGRDRIAAVLDNTATALERLVADTWR